MEPKIRASLIAATLMGATASVAQAADDAGADGASPAGLPGGRPMLQLRPRFSYVDQQNKPENASAVNMRLLLGYRVDPIADFAFTGELVNVSWLNPKHANNEPGRPASRYPLVGDPEKSDINRAFVDYAGIADTLIRLGRQPIKLDNERFVGDADTRQMPQLFDAVSARYRGLPGLDLFGAHAWHVRTFFGDRLGTRTSLFNARAAIDESWPSVGVYGYFQDQPRILNGTGLADNSNRIVGARIEGDRLRTGTVRWYYTAETATQRPYADGDSRIRARYQRFAFGPIYANYSAQFNYERLGSNSGRYGFQTPLTYNVFQGYAYEFFTTPREGVRDLNVSVGAAFGAWSVRVKRHWFRSDFGDLGFGREWDAAIAYRVSASLTVRAVLARFAGSAAPFTQPDAARHTLTLQYNY